MTQDDGWTSSYNAPNALTFTTFAAQVGPGIEHSPANHKAKRRAKRLCTVSWVNEKGLRLAAMAIGTFAIGYGATKGVDGALIAAGSLLIGYAIGKKA